MAKKFTMLNTINGIMVASVGIFITSMSNDISIPNNGINVDFGLEKNDLKARKILRSLPHLWIR